MDKYGRDHPGQQQATICVAILWIDGWIHQVKRWRDDASKKVLSLLWARKAAAASFVRWASKTKRYKSYFSEFDNSFSSINLNATTSWVLSIRKAQTHVGDIRSKEEPLVHRYRCIFIELWSNRPIERIEFPPRPVLMETSSSIRWCLWKLWNQWSYMRTIIFSTDH